MIKLLSKGKEIKYIDLAFYLGEKAINLHIKLDDEGIDVYNESGGQYDQNPIVYTWTMHNEFGVPG
jgi:hypothetical protein